MVGVSFDDAVAYCDWLSKKENIRYRLPTEAEWECACRAGTKTYFSFGDAYRGTIHQFANVANVELERAAPGRVLLQWLVDVAVDPEDGHVFTAPVGSYQPNAWGLYDLHGNVWEWCQDQYLDTYYKQFDRNRHREVRRRAVDPVCEQRWNDQGDWRVIRGGSWFISPIQARSGVRSMFEQRDAAAYLGFRVVREAPESLAVAAQDRFQESQAAFEFLRSAARASREDNDGHLKFEFSGDQLSDEIFKNLSQLDYSVALEIQPPGQLTADMIKKIATVKRLAGLKLSIGGKAITSDDFAPLANQTQLQWLQITGNPDLDDGLPAHFRNAANLRSIHFQGSRITDAGVSKLAKLKSLETLHLSTSQATGVSLERFVGSPLREVSFSNLSDEGAALLREFPTLGRVNVRKSPIGRDGLDAITSCPRLASLQVEDCRGLQDDDFSIASQARQA